MFKHDKFKELFSAYLDQEASIQEQRLIEVHLEECRHCRKEFNILQRLQYFLRLWGDQELSFDLEEKIKTPSFFEGNKTCSTVAKKKNIFFIVWAGFIIFALSAVLLRPGGYFKNFTRRFSQAIDHKGSFILDKADKNNMHQAKRYADAPLPVLPLELAATSYENIRRFVNAYQLPPKEAVRIEEMINHFSYEYPQPYDGLPLSLTTELAVCPWNRDHDLLLIGIQSKGALARENTLSNLVFLIDVSGSMNEPDKLPLVKKALRLLADALRSQDRVAVVVYAGARGVVLDSTAGAEREKIIEALDWLEAGGLAAAGEGVTKAFSIARENFIKGANNRVILVTDGDFDVGTKSTGDLIKLIDSQRKEGILFTVLGFGSGKAYGRQLEKIGSLGGGYFYIDNILEAKKIFKQELRRPLVHLVEDVEIEVEFDPAQVSSYRLIGHEEGDGGGVRSDEDYKKDDNLVSGESITLLYEIAYSGEKEDLPVISDLKYRKITLDPSQGLLTVKVGYKNPGDDASQWLSREVLKGERNRAISNNFLFASAVAEFGLLLRHSEHKAGASYESLIQRARKAKGADIWGYRHEFLRLVESAQLLSEAIIDH